MHVRGPCAITLCERSLHRSNLIVNPFNQLLRSLEFDSVIGKPRAIAVRLEY